MTSNSHLTDANRAKTARATADVLKALEELVAEGSVVNIHAVHRRAGVARGFIYGNPELAAMIRSQEHEPRLRQPPALAARSSDASLRTRLADALDRIRDLSAECNELRKQNSALLAANRDLRQRRPG